MTKDDDAFTHALARLLLPVGVRGRLNSTYEDECLPMARDFVRRLRRAGFKIKKKATGRVRQVR
jgi:hypothetical protein